MENDKDNKSLELDVSSLNLDKNKSNAHPANDQSDLKSLINQNQISGNKTLGRYELIELIGEGGMGKVYKAYDPKLCRYLALKILSEKFKEYAQERFIKEARTVAKFFHKNIIQIFDIDREDKQLFFTMQYIEGENLGKLLKEKKISTEKALEILIKVAKAMVHAHNHNIIHRDIKPTNILIDSEGEPYIIDFGLVKEQGESFITSENIVGTPSYMSPEQVEGKEIDFRSDIYSLGVTLYQILTGKLPFEKIHIAAVLYAIANEEPKKPIDINPQISNALNSLCLKAIAKNRDNRFLSMLDFAKAIEQAISYPNIQESLNLKAPITANKALYAFISKEKEHINIQLDNKTHTISNQDFTDKLMFWHHDQKQSSPDCFGIELLKYFFPGELAKHLLGYISQCEQQKQRATLQIVSNDSKIFELPFELLKHPEKGFLVISGLVIIRTPKNSIDKLCPSPGSLPLKVLTATTTPENSSLRDYEKEQELLIQAFDNHLHPKMDISGELHFVEEGTLDALEHRCKEIKPQIVHLNTSIEGKVISFANNSGQLAKIEMDLLSQELRQNQDLRLLYINDSNDSKKPQSICALLQNGIPMIIHNPRAIIDKATATFIGEFYQNIAYGNTISEALYQARRALLTTNKHGQWWLPTFYSWGQWQTLVDPSLPVKEKTESPGFTLGGTRDLGTGFVGRRKDLWQIRNWLTQGERVIEISGIGGIGKSSLTARLATGLNSEGYEIIGLSGKFTPAILLQKLQTLAPEEIEKQLLAPDLVGYFSKQLRLVMAQGINRKKVVLIFDNFEDNQGQPDSDETTQIISPNLQDCLQQMIDELSDKPVVIFTTRYCASLKNKKSYQLQPLPFPDFWKKLERLSELRKLQANAKKKLYYLVGGHPLVLDILNSLVREKIEEFTLLEEASEDEILQNWQMLDNASEQAHKQIIDKIFLDRLWQNLNQEEREFLQACSIFRIPISGQGVEAILKTSASNKTKLRLRKLSLLNIDEQKRYLIHGSIADFVLAAERIDATKLQSFHHEAASYLHHTQEISYLEGLIQAKHHYFKAGKYNLAAEIVFNTELIDEGQYQEASQLYQEILLAPITKENKAFALYSLGLCASHQGQLDQALEHYNASLKISEKTDNASLMACALCQLSKIYEQKGALDKAIGYHRRCITLKKDIEEAYQQNSLTFSYAGSIALADSMQFMGRDHQRKGALNKALVDYLYALSLLKKLGAGPSVASCFYQIGTIHEEKENLDESMKYYRQSLQLSQQINNPTAIAAASNQIGTLYQKKGDINEALKNYQKALTLREQIGNPAEMAQTLESIGTLYRKSNKLEKSVEYYTRSLKLREQIGNSSLIASSWEQMGKVYYQQQEWEQALECHQKSFQLRDKANNAIGMALSLNHIGKIYQQREEYQQALNYYKLSLKHKLHIEEAPNRIYESKGKIDRELSIAIINDVEIKLYRGDITKINTDSIINPTFQYKTTREAMDIVDDNWQEIIENSAYSYRIGTYGVTNNILKAAGQKVYEEYQDILKNTSFSKGQARITSAGNLPAKNIIHTIGPAWQEGEANEAEILANCYKNCLALAQENQLKSIVFPSIATGGKSYPIEEAVLIAKESVEKVLKTPGSIEWVGFCLFSYYDFCIYEKTWKIK